MDPEKKEKVTFKVEATNGLLLKLFPQMIKVILTDTMFLARFFLIIYAGLVSIYLAMSANDASYTLLAFLISMIAAYDLKNMLGMVFVSALFKSFSDSVPETDESSSGNEDEG